MVEVVSGVLDPYVEVPDLLDASYRASLLRDVLRELADEHAEDNGDGVYARLRVSNQALSDHVGRRLRAALPTMPGLALHDKWFYTAYDTGGYIAPHMDGTVTRRDATKSAATVLIYLTDGFRGGDTEVWDVGRDRWVRINPVAGKALLLSPTTLHAAAAVASGGPKVVVRSDLFLSECSHTTYS